MEENEHRAAHAVASAFVPDADLAKLEKRWQKVFRQAKPGLTALQNDVEEVWDNAPDWLARTLTLPKRKCLPRLNFSFSGCAATGYKPG
ncbi:hypothetical protein LP417_14895 [Polaromonas sp. P1-6]|nr:hypothetical protein LP417_14895 [Polaromonas sp. P1-6]